ncbi:MAG: sulfotransferase domain-containing protein [Sphingomonadales bacterium]|nr:sulfotransferase domain-containing protein [Sphingomonadales bacterium]
MDSTTELPRKTRELQNHHMDSTVWNDFQFRDDDVIVATYGKSGTTWTQQIVGQILLGPDPSLPVAEMSPWLDLRVPPKHVKLPEVEAQTHRRFVKTHLPVDALRFSDKAKYIFIGRDGRDVIWSMYNHHANANAKWYEAMNDTPGLVGPKIERPNPDICAYFREWLERDGFPFWAFWENIRSWWEIRHLPNVMMVHFAELKRDLGGKMRAIADFLDVSVAPELWPELERYCSFDWMKANAAHVAPLGGAIFEGGAETFINKGVNGRWQEALPAADSAAYETKAIEELGAECAAWLGQR